MTTPQCDSYEGQCVVQGAVPAWMRGTLFRVGPGLWEVGTRQLRNACDGFAVICALTFDGNAASSQQRFVDDDAYRAAREGRLIVDRLVSRRRFEGWGAWAQSRIQARSQA